jgi:hypothetical protein
MQSQPCDHHSHRIEQAPISSSMAVVTDSTHTALPSSAPGSGCRQKIYDNNQSAKTLSKRLQKISISSLHCNSRNAMSKKTIVEWWCRSPFNRINRIYPHSSSNKLCLWEGKSLIEMNPIFKLASVPDPAVEERHEGVRLQHNVRLPQCHGFQSFGKNTHLDASFLCRLFPLILTLNTFVLHSDDFLTSTCIRR